MTPRVGDRLELWHWLRRNPRTYSHEAAAALGTDPSAAIHRLDVLVARGAAVRIEEPWGNLRTRPRYTATTCPPLSDGERDLLLWLASWGPARMREYAADVGCHHATARARAAGLVEYGLAYRDRRGRMAIAHTGVSAVDGLFSLPRPRRSGPKANAPRASRAGEV